MNKNQKLLLGVGLVAVAGYLLWQQNQKKSFANAMGRAKAAPIFGGGGGCGKGSGRCCFAKSCNDGKCQCCKGFEESGTDKMGCPGSGFADYGTPDIMAV